MAKEIIYKEQITHLLLLILDIAGYDTRHSKDFEEEYKKRLKFQKQTDWKRYRASIDVLNDTEYAIMSAFKYQLGDLSNNNYDSGEIYIRLYGILNAVYLQMNAYKEIAFLVNFPKKDDLSKLFEELDIYKLRGIAGSHTPKYLHDDKTVKDNGINKTTSFRIIQFHLEKTGSKIVAQDENDITFNFNLLKCLTEYEKIVTDLLIQLINHVIKVLVLKKEDKEEMRNRLKEMLPNLIDYSKINENKKFEKKRDKGLKKKNEDLTRLLEEDVNSGFPDN